MPKIKTLNGYELADEKARESLDDKISKFPDLYGYNRIFSQTANTKDIYGQIFQTANYFKSNPTAKSGVAGYHNGNLGCATPIELYHTANKQYVDDKAKLYRHIVKMTIGGQSFSNFGEVMGGYVTFSFESRSSNAFCTVGQGQTSIAQLSAELVKYFDNEIWATGTVENCPLGDSNNPIFLSKVLGVKFDGVGYSYSIFRMHYDSYDYIDYDETEKKWHSTALVDLVTLTPNFEAEYYPSDIADYKIVEI